MGLSKKVRFEVFKRDSFTCQYCGEKAPDVVLECDHIDPVSKGGGDDMLNLVTACQDCNRGKSATRLDDASALERRRAQLEQLQERREQIEMMAEWHRGVAELDVSGAEAAGELWNELTDGSWHLTDHGLKRVRSLIRRFGLDETLTAMRIASDTYFRREEGKVTLESVEYALDKLGGICFNRKRWKDNPEGAEEAKVARRFVRAYRDWSHHPPDWQLLRWWEQAPFSDPIEAVNMIRNEFCEGEHTSYWSAAQTVLSRPPGWMGEEWESEGSY